MITHQEFAMRRQRLMQHIGKGCVVIVAAAPEYFRNGDAHYPYRQDSDFYYLTGFPEPEAIAVLIADDQQEKYILFNRPRHPAQEIWTGKRAGQMGACEDYGVDEAYPIAEFAEKLPQLIQAQQKVFCLITRQSELDKKIRSLLIHQTPVELQDILHEIRLFKSEAEITLLRKAAKISAQAHKRAMHVCRPDLYEYQIEAELLHEFYKEGSRAVAYPSVVAAGKNSCVLHYVENNARLKNNELLLVDAGCEYDYYASDITRTFPINGRFNEEQRAIYELVLDAQMKVIEAIRPGVRWNELQEISERVITEGLLKLGILQGDFAQLLAEKVCRVFYMHRLSHWLGMDVHDSGPYKVNGEWRTLEPGMVFTVEPGIYISAEHALVDKKWQGIGVRIEDDVLVTETGCEVLSADAPKLVAEIERLMKKSIYIET